MTDKEVIIDGVNVAGCNWLGFSQTCQYEQGFDGCKSIPNCLYKQLQRLQAENTDLKLTISGSTFFCQNCENLSREKDRYKQALEEIKEKAQENDELLQGYHHEWANNKLILKIINEVLKDGI